jgi:hypothetical protein
MKREVVAMSSRIAVEVDGVAAAAHQVLVEAEVAAQVAESAAVTTSSGCARVDGTLAEFVRAWAAQLAGLGALSTSLGVALAGAAGSYASTEQAIAAGY